MAECDHPSVIVSSRPFAIRETGRSLNENEIFSWVKNDRVYYYQTFLVLFVHKNRHQWIIYLRQNMKNSIYIKLSIETQAQKTFYRLLTWFYTYYLNITYSNFYKEQVLLLMNHKL